MTDKGNINIYEQKKYVKDSFSFIVLSGTVKGVLGFPCGEM